MDSSIHPQEQETYYEEEPVTAYEIVEAVIYLIVLALLTYGASAMFGS